jgi:hypothetical protein
MLDDGMGFSLVPLNRGFETRSHNGHKNVNRHGDPDLGLDGVLGSAEKGVDAQMPLDPAKEELRLALYRAQMLSAGSAVLLVMTSSRLPVSGS